MNSTNVALVFYCTRRNKNGIYSLAGIIEQDPELSGFPLFFAGSQDKIMSSLENIATEYDKVILGFSFFTTNSNRVRQLLAKIKTRFGNRIVYIAGGPHPSGNPEDTLQMGFDVAVTGEAEVTFPALLKHIIKEKDYGKLPGMAFLKSDGDMQLNRRQNPVNLDPYPPFSEKYGKFGPIEITRGCPFGCRFCQTSYIFGTKPRHRSPETILNWVTLMKKRGLKDVRFVTPNALGYGSSDGKSINLPAVRGLLKGLRGILKDEGRFFFGSFPSEIRPEFVTGESLRLIKEYSDNDNLVIGAQSGSDRILRSCHRGHDTHDVVRAVDLILDEGFKAYVDVIFGLPGETQEDVEKTMELMENLGEKGARIHAHTFLPLAGTPFGNEPPGKLGNELKLELSRMVSRGTLFGSWLQQEEQGEDLKRFI